MAEIIKINCPCGQENELVESPEGLRYNVKRHGNGELCRGRCFNCFAPLKGLEPKTEEKAQPSTEKTVDAGKTLETGKKKK